MKVYMYVWSEAERVFFSHKENWVLMKFGGRKFKVMKHWGFWQSFTRFPSPEFSVSSKFFWMFFHVPFVMDNGALFIGKALEDF